MSTKPTFVATDPNGNELSIWPPIPGAEEAPVIQIDNVEMGLSLAAEFTPEQASAIAAAVLAAADRK